MAAPDRMPPSSDYTFRSQISQRPNLRRWRAAQRNAVLPHNQGCRPPGFISRSLPAKKGCPCRLDRSPHLSRAPWSVRGKPRPDRQRAFARSSSGTVTGRASPSGVPGGSLTARGANPDSVLHLLRSASGTQKTVSHAAGGSAYRDAAEASGCGAG